MKASLTPRYSILQAMYWMGFAVILGFASPYLLSQGFTSGQVGTVIAVAGVVSALIQPVLASYADRPGSLPLQTLLTSVSGVITVCAVGLLVTPGKVIAAGALYGCAIALLQIATPLINSLGIQGGDRVDFGIARGIGSVGYAAAAYGLGALTGTLGSGIIPGVMAVAFVLLGVLVWFYPKTVTSQTAPSEEAPKGAGPVEFLRKYPRFCIVLVGCVFTYVSHALLNSFTFQIAQSKGGGSPEMGVAIAIAAIVEIPTMVVFTRLIKRAPSHLWLRVSGVFFFLKALGTLLAPNILTFYAVQLFQILGWALMAVDSVYYVRDHMAPEDAVKGQAYFTMTYTFGSVLGAVVGGNLIDRLGVPAMLVFASVCGAVGAVVFLLFAAPKKAQPIK